MIRYEKSPMAWRKIFSEIYSKEVRDTLAMDYVRPVFVTTYDLPNMFKDRLVRGRTKLATIAGGDYSNIANYYPRTLFVPCSYSALITRRPSANHFQNSVQTKQGSSARPGKQGSAYRQALYQYRSTGMDP